LDKKDCRSPTDTCFVPSYSSLREDEIRILILKSGAPDLDLSYRLVTCRHEDQLPYDALSYALGNPEKVMLIECNGQITHIPTNLYTALLYLRYRTEDRILWVDTMCVNQDNLVELGEQVNKMARIFSEARRTLVWLGVRNSLMVSEPLHLLESYHFESGVVGEAPTQIGSLDGMVGLDFSKTRKDTSLLKRDWQPLIALLELPWFTRLWVIQEVVCAKRVVVLHGESNISWDTLAKPVKELYHSGLLDADIISKGARGIRAGLEMQYIGEQIRRDNAPSLLHLLLATSLAECSDPRDKVYGVLSMAGDYNARDDILLKPDYRLTPPEVYARVEQWCVKKADLDMLLSCATASRSKVLPS
jgi:hypothetical protein